MNAHVFGVQLVLADIGGWFAGGECPCCSAPMVATKKIAEPFCYSCMIDEQAAEEARAALRRLKWEIDRQRFTDLGIIQEVREAFIL